MKPKYDTLRLLGFIALAFAGFASTTAHAAIDTWQGTADSTDWATNGNWTYSTGAAIATGDSLVFTSANASTSTTLTNTLASTFNVAAITLNSGAPSYTMTGNAFNLTGGITNNSGSLQTINNAITLSNAPHAFNAASGNITLGGAFSGTTQNVTFIGSGTTTLSGTNTFTATGANFGAVLVGGPITAGASTPGNVSITGATTVDGTGFTDSRGLFDIHGNSTLTIQTGGSLTLNGSTGSGTNSIVGQNSTGTSTLGVNGGSLTISGAHGFVFGNNRADATGVLTVSSGTATIIAGSTTLQDPRNFIALGRDNATGMINLDGGTLSTGRQFVRDGSSGGTAGSGTATFNFNGGTLQALADQTSGNGWFETATTSNFRVVTTTVKSGGAKIDTNGFTTNIKTVLAHDSSLGDTADGGLTKIGSGTLTLGGANTYTGPTTISAGRLNVLFGGSIDNSSVSLGAATLGGNGTVGAVTAENNGAIITNGNSNTDALTLASLAFSAPGTMNLNLASDTFTSAVTVTNTLAIGSGFTVNVVTAPSWITGQTYNLINYGTLSGTFSNITKGTILGLGARQIATLGNTGPTDGSITLAITGNTPVWSGIQSNAWTTAIISGSKNWKLLNGGAATDFVINDQVIFDDNATGTTNVDIPTANVQVAGVIFDNYSKAYTISSTGGFGITNGPGSASLIKNGDASVTLNTTNSYTGSTTITAGTLQLGDGTTNGDIAGSSSIANDGTLILNRSTGTFTYGNPTSGSGEIIKNGEGTQIFAGASTRFGITTINGGTLQIGNAGLTGALGPGSITDNASLVFNRSNGIVQGTDFGPIDGTGSVTQAGTGTVNLFGNSYSGGTVINSGTVIVGGDNSLGTGSVTVAGATLSGSTAADVTLANALTAQASTTSVLFTNGKNLSLTGNLSGSGNINRTAAGAAATVFLGGDNSSYSGTFTIDANGSAATRFTAATAGSQAAKWVINQSVNGRASLDFAGGTIKFGSLSGPGFFISAGLGTNTIEVGALGSSETFSGVLNQGTGSTLAVTKLGAGTWTLTGANTYTGDTTVNAGVLAVNGNAIANGNKLVINGGKVAPSGIEVIGTLYFGAAQQASGTWGASGSGATHIDDTRFTGTGVVSVTTGPSAGYTAWADLYAPGQTMDQDHDNDGVKNGIEYFMGQTGSTFTANPAAVNGAVTWPMGATYTGVYGTDYEVQSSTDLVSWSQVPAGTGDNTVSVTAATSVVYDMPTGGKSFVRLVVRH